jgi:hypothetical protein
VVGDEFAEIPLVKHASFHVDSETLSVGSGVKRTPGGSGKITLNQLFQRMPQPAEDASVTSGLSRTNNFKVAAMASVNAYYGRNQNLEDRADHLDYVPPTFPKFSRDMEDQPSLPSPSSTLSKGGSSKGASSKASKPSFFRDDRSSAIEAVPPPPLMPELSAQKPGRSKPVVKPAENVRSISASRGPTARPKSPAAPTRPEPNLPFSSLKRSASNGRGSNFRQAADSAVKPRSGTELRTTTRPNSKKSVGVRPSSSTTADRQRSVSPSTTRLAARRQSANQAPNDAVVKRPQMTLQTAAQAANARQVVERGSKHLNSLIGDLEKTLRNSLSSLTEKLSRSFELPKPMAEDVVVPTGSKKQQIAYDEDDDDFVDQEDEQLVYRGSPAGRYNRYNNRHQAQNSSPSGQRSQVITKSPPSKELHQVDGEWVVVEAVIESVEPASASSQQIGADFSISGHANSSVQVSHTEDDNDMVCQDDSSVASGNDGNLMDDDEQEYVAVYDSSNDPIKKYLNLAGSPSRSEDRTLGNHGTSEMVDLPMGANSVSMDPVTFHRLEFAKEKQKIMEMFSHLRVSEDAPSAAVRTTASSVGNGISYNTSASKQPEFPLRNVGVLAGMLNNDPLHAVEAPTISKASSASGAEPKSYTVAALMKPAPKPVNELGGSIYDQLRSHYSAVEDDDEDEEDDDDNCLPNDGSDHRIISILANEILREQVETKRIEQEKLVQAEMKQRIEEAKKASEILKTDALKASMDALERAEIHELVQDKPVRSISEPQSEEELDASRSYFDSLLVQPLPSAKLAAVNMSAGTGIASDAEIAGQRLEATQSSSWRTSGEDFAEERFHKIVPRYNPQNQPKSELRSTAAEMRMQMIEELHRQDDLFKYAFELSEMEQQRTVQSASELVQMLVSHADKEVLDVKRTQELSAQQQAYELSLATTTANSQLAMHQQRLAQEKELLELQAQLKIESMHSYFLSLRQDANQAADALEQSAQLLEMERNMKEQALRIAISNVNTQEDIIAHQSMLLQQQAQEHQKKMDDIINRVHVVVPSVPPASQVPYVHKHAVASQVNASLGSQKPPGRHLSAGAEDSYEDISEDYSNVFDQESHSHVHLSPGKADRATTTARSRAAGKKLDLTADSESEIMDDIIGSPSMSAIYSVPGTVDRRRVDSSHQHSREDVGEVSEANDRSYERSVEEEDASIQEDSYYQSSAGHKHPAARPPIRNPLSSEVPVSKGKKTLAPAASDYSMDDFEETEEVPESEKEVSEVEEDVPEDADYSQFDVSVASQRSAKPDKRAPKPAHQQPRSQKPAVRPVSFGSDTETSSLDISHPDQIIAEYKREMDNLIKSQQKSLHLRMQVLEAKKERQLEALNSKYGNRAGRLTGDAKRRYDEERESINNLFAEASAGIEKERWELNSKTFRELRKFNKLKNDLALYQSNVDVGQLRLSGQIKPPVGVSGRAASTHAPAAGSSRGRQGPVVALKQQSDSDTYESSFESVYETSQGESSGPETAVRTGARDAVRVPQGIAYAGKTLPAKKSAPGHRVTDEDDEQDIEEIEEEYPEEIEDEIQEEEDSPREAGISGRDESDEYSERWGDEDEIEDESAPASSSRLNLSGVHRPAQKKSFAADSSIASVSRYDDHDVDRSENYSQVFDVSALNSSTVSASKTRRGPENAARALSMSSSALSASASMLRGGRHVDEFLEVVDDDEAESSPATESGDTIEDLEKSIELRQKRIDDLKMKKEAQQLERERLEVIRKKAAEKKMLMDMEAALLKELESESAKIRSEKLSILSLEQVDAAGQGAIADSNNVSAVAEDAKATVFEDRERMHEWKQTLSSAVEDEDAVLSDEIAAEEDSWASGGAIETSKDAIVEGLLHAKVTQEHAAVLLQSAARGYAARKVAAAAKTERDWARAELERLRFEQENLVVSEQMVEEQEELAMDDSFASDDDYIHDRSLGLGFEDEADTGSKKVSPMEKKKSFHLVEEESFIMEESDDEDEIEFGAPDTRTAQMMLVQDQLREAELLEQELLRLAAAKKARDELETEATKKRHEQEQKSKEFVPLPGLDQLDLAPLVPRVSSPSPPSSQSIPLSEEQGTPSTAEDIVTSPSRDSTEHAQQHIKSPEEVQDKPVVDSEEVEDEVVEEIDESVAEEEEESIAEVEKEPVQTKTRGASIEFDDEDDNDYGDDFDNDSIALPASETEPEPDVVETKKESPRHKAAGIALTKHDEDSVVEEIEEDIEDESVIEGTETADTSSFVGQSQDSATASRTEVSPSPKQRDLPVSAVKVENVLDKSVTDEDEELSVFEESHNFSLPTPESQRQPKVQASLEFSASGSQLRVDDHAQSHSHSHSKEVDVKASVSASFDSVLSQTQSQDGSTGSASGSAAKGQAKAGDTSLMYSSAGTESVSVNAESAVFELSQSSGSLTKVGSVSVPSVTAATMPVPDASVPKVPEIAATNNELEPEAEAEVEEEVPEEVEEEEQNYYDNLNISNISSASESEAALELLRPPRAPGKSLGALQLEISTDNELITHRSDEEHLSTNTEDEANVSSLSNPMNESDLDTIAWGQQQNTAAAAYLESSGDDFTGGRRKPTSSILKFTPERGNNAREKSNAEDPEEEAVILLDMPTGDKAKGIAAAETIASGRSLFDQEDEIEEIPELDESVVVDEEEAGVKIAEEQQQTQLELANDLYETLQLSTLTSPAELSAYANTMTDLLLQRLLLGESKSADKVARATASESTRQQVAVEEMAGPIEVKQDAKEEAPFVDKYASYDDSFDESDSEAELEAVSPIAPVERVKAPEDSMAAAGSTSLSSLSALPSLMPPVSKRQQVAVESRDDDELNELYDFEASPSEARKKGPSVVTTPAPTSPAVKDKEETPPSNVISPVPYHADILVS